MDKQDEEGESVGREGTRFFKHASGWDEDGKKEREVNPCIKNLSQKWKITLHGCTPMGLTLLPGIHKGQNCVNACLLPHILSPLLLSS